MLCALCAVVPTRPTSPTSQLLVPALRCEHSTWPCGAPVVEARPALRPYRGRAGRARRVAAAQFGTVRLFELPAPPRPACPISGKDPKDPGRMCPAICDFHLLRQSTGSPRVNAGPACSPGIEGLPGVSEGDDGHLR